MTTRHAMMDGAIRLTDEEITELANAYRAGDNEAGGRLIQSQLAWIVTLVKREALPSSVDQDDVLSELFIVILESLKTFDPSKAKLSTFISIVIQRRVRRVISKLAGKLDYEDSEAPFDGLTAHSDGDSIFDELYETSEIDEVAKFAFRLRARNMTRYHIVKAIEEEFPWYFSAHKVQRSARRRYVAKLIDDTADFLCPGLVRREEPESSIRKQLYRLKTDEFAEVLRLALTLPCGIPETRSIINEEVGTSLSEKSLARLITKFDIMAKRKLVNSHNVERMVLEMIESNNSSVPAPEHKPDKFTRYSFNDLSKSELETMVKGLLTNHVSLENGNLACYLYRRYKLMLKLPVIRTFWLKYSIEERRKVVHSRQSLLSHVKYVVDHMTAAPSELLESKPTKTLPTFEVLSDVAWSAIEPLLPQIMKKKGNRIRYRISALIYSERHRLSRSQVAQLIPGAGNLFQLRMRLQGHGVYDRIVDQREMEPFSELTEAQLMLVLPKIPDTIIVKYHAVPEVLKHKLSVLAWGIRFEVPPKLQEQEAGVELCRLRKALERCGALQALAELSA